MLPVEENRLFIIAAIIYMMVSPSTNCIIKTKTDLLDSQKSFLNSSDDLSHPMSLIYTVINLRSVMENRLMPHPI